MTVGASSPEDARADRRAPRRGGRRGPAAGRRGARAHRRRRPTTFGLIGLARTRARVERPLILEGRAGRGPRRARAQPPVTRASTAAAVGDVVDAGSGAGRRELRVVGIGATAGTPAAAAGPTRPTCTRSPRAERPLRYGLGAAAGATRAPRRRSPAASGATGGLGAQDWRSRRADLTEDARRLLTILADDDPARAARRGVHARHRDRRARARPAPPDRAAAGDRADPRAASPGCSSRTTSCSPRSPRRSASRPARCVAERLSADAADALGAPAARGARPGAARARARRSRCSWSRAATALPAWRAGRIPVQAALALGRGATSARASRVARLARRLRLPVVVGRRRQGRVRAARPHGADGREPRAGRRAGGDRDGLRGDDGPPRPRPGAARPALRPARRVLAAGRRGRRACWPAAARSPRSRACARSMLSGAAAAPRSTRACSTARSRRSPTRSATAAPPARPGEVTLGRGALEALGARIGERVTLRVDGRAGDAVRRRPPRRARRRRARRGDEPARAARAASPSSTSPTGPSASSDGADAAATAASAEPRGRRPRQRRRARSSRSSARRPTCARSSTARSRC